VVNVPSVSEEDQRQLHRNLKDLKWHTTECGNRTLGLLASQGIATVVDATFRERLPKLQDWQGHAVPTGMRDRLVREFALWELAHRQVRDLENEQERLLRDGTEPWLEKIRRLIGLKAIGARSAWVFVQESFGWRQIKNGKELAALAGLTPTPYSSGKSEREQGISKAGDRHVRGMMVEIAWLWLHWQPQSHLSQWYHRRFGLGNKRGRKVGIVALARKLLIASWRHVDQEELPKWAEEKDWWLRVGSTARRHARAGAQPAEPLDPGKMN
jgi:transposase